MSVEPNIPILLRSSFFDGQRLTAQDLSVTQSFHREMRWLHNGACTRGGSPWG